MPIAIKYIKYQMSYFCVLTVVVNGQSAVVASLEDKSDMVPLVKLIVLFFDIHALGVIRVEQTKSKRKKSDAFNAVMFFSNDGQQCLVCSCLQKLNVRWFCM